jgi:hypothetical protein
MKIQNSKVKSQKNTDAECTIERRNSCGEDRKIIPSNAHRLKSLRRLSMIYQFQIPVADEYPA